jgi:hypothetical protein
LIDFWGFCDGEKYYLACSDKFLALRREGNTFELEGEAVFLKEKYSGLSKTSLFNALPTDPIGRGLLGPRVITRIKSIPQVFQLDMERGFYY